MIHSPADHYVLQMLKQILLLAACVAVSMALSSEIRSALMERLIYEEMLLKDEVSQVLFQDTHK